MNPRILAIGVFVSSIGVAGCGDDKATDPRAVVLSLSFLVDGFQFSAESNGATRVGNTVTLTASAAGFRLSAGPGGVTRTDLVRSLTIAIKSAVSGTIAIGGAESPTITFTEQTSDSSLKQWAAGVGAGSGTLVLTEFSASRALGTFSATLAAVTASGAVAAKTITGGTFEVRFE